MLTWAPDPLTMAAFSNLVSNTGVGEEELARESDKTNRSDFSSNSVKPKNISCPASCGCPRWCGTTQRGRRWWWWRCRCRGAGWRARACTWLGWTASAGACRPPSWLGATSDPSSHSTRSSRVVWRKINNKNILIVTLVTVLDITLYILYIISMTVHPLIKYSRRYLGVDR